MKDLQFITFITFSTRTPQLPLKNVPQNIFIPTVFVVNYAWNTTPIDGTYIIRSMLVIGWQLHYPIDINMNTLPTIKPNNAQATLDQLKFIVTFSQFSSFILNIIIEEHHTAHDECINNNHHIVILQIGDIVVDQIEIYIDISKNQVAKLSYAVRSLYRIISSISHDNYFVKKFNKPSSSDLKFMTYDRYPIPHLLNLINQPT